MGKNLKAEGELRGGIECSHLKAPPIKPGAKSEQLRGTIRPRHLATASERLPNTWTSARRYLGTICIKILWGSVGMREQLLRDFRPDDDLSLLVVAKMDSNQVERQLFVRCIVFILWFQNAPLPEIPKQRLLHSIQLIVNK